MRRALTAAVLTVALAASGASLAAPAAADSSGGPVTDVDFGMHIPQISQGEQTTVNEGTVRLWDSGVAWGQVEQKKGKFWWNGLDAAISNANNQSLQILYVLGSTPSWAATSTKQGKYPNKGAASMPKNIKDWRSWVTAVVQRYGASIDAYQIWNEANLSTFWEGTPDQMVTLTKEAAKIIRKYDPSAKIVAASTTVRLQSAYKKFFPAYLKGLKKAGWPVDVISFHGYPAANGTPADRVAYIKQVKADMQKAGVPASKALWDTEVNYGIAGPGAIPRQVVSGANAAGWTAATYLDNVLYGIGRGYWYYWYNNSNLVGIQMFTGTEGALGYQTARNWLSGAFYSCQEAAGGQPNVCQLGDNVNPEVIAWIDSGSATFTVPANVTQTCNALNQCTPVAAGSQVTIGSMPQWFGNPAS
jgi:arabinogalactan endo-1,4-beta-galactosidase